MNPGGLYIFTYLLYRSPRPAPPCICQRPPRSHSLDRFYLCRLSPRHKASPARPHLTHPHPPHLPNPQLPPDSPDSPPLPPSASERSLQKHERHSRTICIQDNTSLNQMTTEVDDCCARFLNGHSSRTFNIPFFSATFWLKILC